VLHHRTQRGVNAVKERNVLSTMKERKTGLNERSGTLWLGNQAFCGVTACIRLVVIVV